MPAKLPSVSKIIASSRCPEREEKLSLWRENNSDKSKQYKKSGNNLHNLVELYLKDELLDPLDTGNRYFEILLPFLESLNTFDTIAEMPIIYLSNNIPYSGRIDILFGECLVELKTKNSDKPLHPNTLEEYCLQLGAYSLALKDMGLQVSNNLLVLCYSNKSPDILTPDISLWENKFLSILYHYYDKPCPKISFPPNDR